MDIRSMFSPKSPFRALFGAFYPHPAHKSALRAEGATHFLAPGQRGCSTVPLATVLPPPAPRPTPGPTGAGRAQTLPLAYCMQPTAELTKVEQDPISMSGASIFSMSPNQAIPTEKLIRFFPTRRRPTVDHSLVAGAARRQWLQACLPDGHKAAIHVLSLPLASSRNTRRPGVPTARRPWPNGVPKGLSFGE